MKGFIDSLGVYILTSDIYIAIGERGHTPSRGAPCQYLAGPQPAREPEIYLTACDRYDALR
jgi:hypothetical protein